MSRLQLLRSDHQLLFVGLRRVHAWRGRERLWQDVGVGGAGEGGVFGVKAVGLQWKIRVSTAVEYSHVWALVGSTVEMQPRQVEMQPQAGMHDAQDGELMMRAARHSRAQRCDA